MIWGLLEIDASLFRFPIGGDGMIYAYEIRLRKKRLRKRKIRKCSSAVNLNRITALFISTRNYINPNNLPIYSIITASTSGFSQVCFFNVKYERYLSLSDCRSPPSVLVFHKKNQNGGLENEKNQFAGLLPVLSV